MATVVVAILVAVTAFRITRKDDISVFLEDDPAMRAHEDDPVTVAEVGDLDVVVEKDVWVAGRRSAV